MNCSLLILKWLIEMAKELLWQLILRFWKDLCLRAVSNHTLAQEKHGPVFICYPNQVGKSISHV